MADAQAPDPLLPIVLRTVHGEVEVYAHGGHVARWRPAGHDDVLFMSPASKFAAGEAIRGGVPVIFPWFGDDPDGLGRPAHGFARRRAWQRVDDGKNAARAQFRLHDDDSTRALWPYRFALHLEVEIGAALRLALRVENRGDQAFRCEPALHTYLAVGDVREVRVFGLEAVRYHDKVTRQTGQIESPQALRITGETDRVYCGTDTSVRVVDPRQRRSIEVRKDNARSTIVWNPWSAKAARMADLGAEQWPRMLCVESGNVAQDALTLPPGANHTLTATLAVAAFP